MNQHMIISMGPKTRAQWADETVSLTFHSILRKSYTELSIDASYQISVHLVQRFQRRFLANRPIRNKNCLWRPCLLTNRDEICNLYRGHSINASYQESVYLAKQFQRRRYFFRNEPIRNQNCLWWQCLLTNRDDMSIINRGPSIDASYQISFHLAMQFQRRFLEIDQSETRIVCGSHVCKRIQLR